MGRLLEPWRMGADFLQRVRNGVLNYVMLRPVMAVVAFVADAGGFYCEGELWNPRRVHAAVPPTSPAPNARMRACATARPQVRVLVDDDGERVGRVARHLLPPHALHRGEG